MHQLHVTSVATITTVTTITSTETKGIKVKLSGNIYEDVELNPNKIYTFSFPKGCVSNFSGIAKSIKLKLLGRVERDAKHSAHTDTTTTAATLATITMTTTTEVKGWKEELSGKVQPT
jgi:hypothetical protein